MGIAASGNPGAVPLSWTGGGGDLPPLPAECEYAGECIGGEGAGGFGWAGVVAGAGEPNPALARRWFLRPPSGRCAGGTANPCRLARRRLHAAGRPIGPASGGLRDFPVTNPRAFGASGWRGFRSGCHGRMPGRRLSPRAPGRQPRIVAAAATPSAPKASRGRFRSGAIRSACHRPSGSR